ncbi:MAG: SH3 domain-containing protein, partial [Opitutales bacterium]
MASGQALLPDYLDANAGSPQLSRLRPGVPSSNAVTYRSRLMGYVQSANANEAPAGTAVRAAPTTASDLVATIETGDSVTVTRSGEWSQIVLRRPIDGASPLSGAEVEPVVLGRKSWEPGQQPIAESSAPGDVRELDPLETEQDPSSKITLPVEPPGP